MDLKKAILILTLFFASATGAFATNLPDSVNQFVLKDYPNASIRFDGLITLSDGTVYLPIIPSYIQRVSDLEVTSTIPANASLKSEPDVIVFNNNFALLKLIRTKNGILTVCQNPNIPMVIKTGAIPQDLVVPRGLVLPDILKGILGNVQIPLLSDSNIIKEPASEQKAPLTITPVRQNFVTTNVEKTTGLAQGLQNKIYYIANNNSLLLKVFSSNSPQPMYSLKLASVPRKIQAVQDGKYLLVLTNTQKQIDVIDVKNEYIAKQIDLSAVPSDITVNNAKQTAYVSSESDRSIFVIDLKEMKIKEKIALIGIPENIAISNDGTQLGYLDKTTSNVYVIRLDGNYANKLITNCSNVSKIALNNDKLYTLVRTEGKLKISDYNLDRDFEEEKYQADRAKQTTTPATLAAVIDGIQSGIETTMQNKKELVGQPEYYATKTNDVLVGQKPTDLLFYKNKMFVLCSASNDIQVIDTTTQAVTKVIKLPTAGFPRKITKVTNTNLALITNVSQKKYAVLDLDKEAITQAVGISTPVNEIMVVEKR